MNIFFVLIELKPFSISLSLYFFFYKKPKEISVCNLWSRFELLKKSVSHFLPFDNFQVMRLFLQISPCFLWFHYILSDWKWEKQMGNVIHEYEPGNEYVEGKWSLYWGRWYVFLTLPFPLLRPAVFPALVFRWNRYSSMVGWKSCDLSCVGLCIYVHG